MLVPFENVFYMTAACIVALIQLLCSVGKLNGIELPLELLQESVNGGKSTDFARRIAFPLANTDNGVELPPNVEDGMELNAPKGFGTTGIQDNIDLVDDLPAKSEIPPWVQMQQQQQQPQEAHQHHHSNMLPKHLKLGKHHHDMTTSSAAASPLRRCSIEISSKIPGICQAMGSIGNACVSGDYIDVFNGECL